MKSPFSASVKPSALQNINKHIVISQRLHSKRVVVVWKWHPSCSVCFHAALAGVEHVRDVSSLGSTATLNTRQRELKANSSDWLHRPKPLNSFGGGTEVSSFNRRWTCSLLCSVQQLMQDNIQRTLLGWWTENEWGWLILCRFVFGQLLETHFSSDYMKGRASVLFLAESTNCCVELK